MEIITAKVEKKKEHQMESQSKAPRMLKKK